MNKDNLTASSIVGKLPAENEMLNISANWVEISFLSSFNIFVGMLFGLTYLNSEKTLYYVVHIYL